MFTMAYIASRSRLLRCAALLDSCSALHPPLDTTLLARLCSCTRTTALCRWLVAAVAATAPPTPAPNHKRWWIPWPLPLLLCACCCWCSAGVLLLLLLVLLLLLRLVLLLLLLLLFFQWVRLHFCLRQV